MNEMLLKARKWLFCATRKPFDTVLRESKITPRQKEICELKFVEGLTNYQIAMQLNLSEKTIEKELNTVYKRITYILRQC